MSKQKTKEVNEFKKLAKLRSEDFQRKKSIPSFIANIKVDENDYKPLQLEGLNFTIPTPDEAIERTNIVADEIMRKIDNKYEKKFNSLKDLIGAILQFTANTDVFYYQTTRSEYNTLPINEEMKNEFCQNAKALDESFTNLIETADHPISSVIQYMKFDNSINRANKLESTLRNELFNIYSQGLANIFKYIVIGTNA